MKALRLNNHMARYSSHPHLEYFLLLVVAFRLPYAVFCYFQSASSVVYMYDFQPSLLNLFNIQGVIHILNQSGPPME